MRNELQQAPGDHRQLLRHGIPAEIVPLARTKLLAQYPAAAWPLNRELSALLVALDAPEAVARTLDLETRPGPRRNSSTIKRSFGRRSRDGLPSCASGISRGLAPTPRPSRTGPERIPTSLENGFMTWVSNPAMAPASTTS